MEFTNNKTLRTLMKKGGAEIVGRATYDKLIDYLKEYANSLTGFTLDIALSLITFVNDFVSSDPIL
ncbi:MAG: hypothetical protein ACFFB0_09615 [Promethearchaeota archaeon]